MVQVKNMFVIIALFAMTHASAGCLGSFSRHLYPGQPAAQAAPTLSITPQLTTAFYQPDAKRTNRLEGVADWEDGQPGIVGLWQFQLSGFVVDWGTQAWHADGTELIFSVGQNPETGDVCQGVWRKVGPRTYTLNHVAMGWAAPGADPTQGSEFLRVHIHMVVMLDPGGQKFTGTYAASVYMESAGNPFDEDPNSNRPIASGTGAITANRVNPDSAP